MATNFTMPSMFDTRYAMDRQMELDAQKAGTNALGGRYGMYYNSSLLGDRDNATLMSLTGMMGGQGDPRMQKQMAIDTIMQQYPSPETAEDFKALKTDALIKKIKAKITKAQSDLVKLSANKIISETLESDGVDDINSFIEWASDALPDFISIEDIRTLGNNMKSGGMRVGAFVMALNNIAGTMSIDGKIYTGTSTKHAYHEAFHALLQ